jgi:hypothetical protein
MIDAADCTRAFEPFHDVGSDHVTKWTQHPPVVLVDPPSTGVFDSMAHKKNPKKSGAAIHCTVTLDGRHTKTE